MSRLIPIVESRKQADVLVTLVLANPIAIQVVTNPDWTALKSPVVKQVFTIVGLLDTEGELAKVPEGD